jgi:hypothetical protein
MAIAGSTIVATVNENINPVWIAQQQRITIDRTPFTFTFGALRVDLASRNTKNYSTPIRDEMAKATPYIETDLVTSTPNTRTEVTIGTSKVIKATFLSIEAVELSMWSEFAGAIDELQQANMRAVDDDFLGLADDFTAFVGDNATTMTARNLISVHTAYRAQTKNVMSAPLMYFSTEAMAQLQDDSITNAASIFGSIVGPQLQEASQSVSLGKMSSWNGFDMITTDNLPVGDVTGKSNMVISRGEQQAAIAMPLQHGVRIEQAFRVENQGFWVVGTANFGMGIAQDKGGLTFITSAA